MKIVYMGTPDFAVSSLRALVENGYDIIGVVSQPDKPKGRNNKLTAPPVKEYALEHNLKVFQPLKAKNQEFIDQLKKLNPDLIVVVAYGHLLPAEILDIPRYGCINIHGSLLPKYRGSAPIQWSIINGEKITGVTSMYMNIGMDTGDIILKREISIDTDDTSETLFNKLSLLGGDTLLQTLKLIEDGNVERIKQNDEDATYASMLTKDTGNIDWTKSAISIKNLFRGTYPWPGVFTYYKNNKIKIFDIDSKSINSNATPGTIIEVNKDNFIVQTGDGQVVINEIQFDSGKRMSVKSYLLGHDIEINVVLKGDGHGVSI